MPSPKPDTATVEERSVDEANSVGARGRDGGELFIVDNSDTEWKGLKYLQDWTDIASSFAANQSRKIRSLYRSVIFGPATQVALPVKSAVCVRKCLTNIPTDCNLKFMTTTDTINGLISVTMQKIADAAEKRDLPTVTLLTRRAGELESMQKTVLDIEEKLKEFEKAPAGGSSNGAQSTSPLRQLPIEVTQGMINQNLLTLTAHVSRGRIRSGEDMTIEAYPSGEQFRTELLSTGNKVRERGAIGRFYREAGVRAGDFVILEEVSRGRWTLKKAPAGQYKSRQAMLEPL
jgi:hypothetical protein